MTPEQFDGVWQRSRCLFDQAAVEAALDRMAAAVSTQLAGTNPILMCVMHGGLITAGALALRLQFPLQMDYLHATRYREQTSGADLQWKVSPSLPLQGRVVVLVDDILDEGETLARVREFCLQQGSAQVYTAVLIDKKHERKIPGCQADFVGLEAEDFYLFGYGMDYRGYLRNAAGIFAIDDADY
ncbi:MAG: hypoxanthine-guanine phosphoribosyltransferase [Gammaproteobacteria bacterium]|nr:hypoxanthine-guanine phosphoribosyltransferase [Pseudomonadales bacterium]